MKVHFTVNGKPFSVNLESLPADITLNTFIREHAGFSGTKYMCLEGGCGVCVCVVKGRHPTTGEVHSWAVNSCLTLLNVCADWEIFTSEGIGNKRDGYHPIQKCLAKMNGTQCGYCSPGFVMNMFGLLEANGGKVTMKEVENSFGGNICRCTGYRPIMDAMKSFAVDTIIQVPPECRDIEDLTARCAKTGRQCNSHCHQRDCIKRPSVLYDDGTQWHWPKNLSDLFEALAAIKEEKYMLVAGNTAHGVYRRSDDIKAFIDVNDVAELHRHSIDGDTLTLGGNLSLTETMQVFQNVAKQPGFEYCQQLYNHFDLIANVPVRNMGTLAGNLTIKQKHSEFPSDIFITFEALNVRVVVNSSATAGETLNLQDYLKAKMEKKVVVSFLLSAYPKDDFIFDSYKVMPRAQNAHAYVNAAFLLGVDKSMERIKSARICFGGISPDYVHAVEIEKMLIGQDLFDNTVVSNIFSSLQENLHPDSVLPDSLPEYRQKLACGLFYKFLLRHAPADKVKAEFISGGPILIRPLSSGIQTFDTVEKSYPVTKPVEKVEAMVQCSGEATYMNDLPVQPNQVWATFVHATKVGATIEQIDASEALKVPGVLAFYSAKDIPGNNAFVDKSFDFVDNEEIFCAGLVRYYNQPLGVIVALSSDIANGAAKKVNVMYSKASDLILPSMVDVIEGKHLNRIKDVVASPIKKLEVCETSDITASGIFDIGLQYHFTMEPQTTVVLPFEDGLQVYSATQWMDMTQFAIAKMLQMKVKDVQLKVRRLGGAYGSKITRGNQVACAAALAAAKLNRPVRFVQTIESMMGSLGKRWACRSDYEFHVKANGKIVTLRNTFYEDAGWSLNEAPIGLATTCAKNCYEFHDNYKLDGKAVVTDAPSHTWCRAPGSVEGFAMIENILEHIAFETQQDPVDVRMANIVPGKKMQELLPQFVKSTEYRKRKSEIEVFNKKNRWVKKGLGVSIMEYPIFYFGSYPATVSIYHGDGSVVISHGGIEMGQGMNTKIAQVAAYTVGIPLDMVKIESSDTLNGANSMVTGGAVGSESLCYAVRKSCDILLKRLEPVRADLKNPTWHELVEAAHLKKINMIASDYYKEGDMAPYTICGLSLTEVEVDILTGNHQITRVDILEDTGESLNPNVDVGQIEGAFVMGLGYWLTEQLVYDRQSGELLTNRTWNYKPPGCKDIPIDFRIELLQKSANPAGFMRSKATGEPAVCISISVIFAIQHAIQSARNDAGLKREWVRLGAPTTPEHIVLNSGTSVSMFGLQ